MNSAASDLELARFERAESLFAAAVKLDEDERAGFLMRECEDSELRRFVLSLLAGQEPVESAIEATIVDAMSAAFGEGQAGTDALKGERIGPYRLSAFSFYSPCGPGRRMAVSGV